MRRLRLVETFCQDVRYGFRGLAKSPLLVLVAALSLGLGIGANLTVYSVLKSVLLDSVTASRPERLLNVRLGRNYQISYPNYRDLAESKVFAELAAYIPGLGSEVNWRFGNETKALSCLIVSGNFFQVLGIEAGVGRTFTADEAPAEHNPQWVVLSYSLWQRHLGGDPNIIGRVLNLNGVPYTVLGLLPKGHRSVLGYGIAPEVYLPISNLMVHDLSDRGAPNFELIGRLAEGATREQAQVALLTVAKRLEHLYPKENRDFGQLREIYALSGLQRFRQDPDATPMLAFFGLLIVVVGMVLLVACANVASLLLAWGSNRRREIALRLAIGASQSRLVQQLLTENVLLSALSTVLGLLLSRCLTSLMSGIQLPLPLPVEWQWGTDGRLLLLALLLMTASTLLSGITPGLQATRFNLVPALKQQESQFTHRRFTLRNTLVIGQMALSLVLLATALLFLRNLLHILGTNPGFDTEHTLSIYLRRLSHRYTPEQSRLFSDQVLDRLARIPSVEAASSVSFLPLGFFGWGGEVHKEGESETERFGVGRQSVGADYFIAMGIPLMRGRKFHVSDRQGRPVPVIVNETLVQRLFPGQEPIGQRIVMGQGDRQELMEIVGVVRDSKSFSLGEEPGPLVYDLHIAGGTTMTLVARTAGPPSIALHRIKTTLGELDPSAAVEVKTMRDHLALAFFPSRVGALLLTILAGLALTLAMVGLYGVMAYTIGRRTHEIGIRMALGASRAQVLRLVVEDGLVLVGVGIAIGLVISLLVTRPLALLLAHGVSPADPVNFFAVALLLALVAIGACLIPARHAMRVDPMVALRDE